MIIIVTVRTVHGRCSAVFVILRLAILVLYRLVTDRRTDTWQHIPRYVVIIIISICASDSLATYGAIEMCFWFDWFLIWFMIIIVTVRTVHGRCSAGVSSALVPASPPGFLRRRRRLHHVHCRYCFCAENDRQARYVSEQSMSDVHRHNCHNCQLLAVSLWHLAFWMLTSMSVLLIVGPKCASTLPRHQTEIVTGAHPGSCIAYTRAMSEHRCCPKNESKYSYNAFQARDRRDKSECGMQGCHLVFFDF